MSYKERILRKILETPQKRFTRVSLRIKLDVQEGDIGTFNKALTDLVIDNVIVKTKKNKYCLNKDLNIFIGKFLYNQKGYGFCIKTSKQEEENELREIFIPPHFIKNALHEDIVVVKVNKISTIKSQKSEGEIISILERSISNLVGTYIKEEQNEFGFVVPDNSKFNMDIYIPNGKSLTAKAYDKVVVKIVNYPEGDKKPVGIIQEVIGFKTDVGVDYLSIISEFNLKETFSPKAIHQVERISETISKDELKRREDLTDMCIFTIDGEDSKDLDDAISVEKINGGYRLGVHIADVTHYVKEDSPLDKDALNRGTSVYLINKVIPMLPKKLSNNLCSLNPLETKLTLSVFMNINKNGNVTKHEIVESYIESKSKLWYTNVSDFIEDKDELKCNDSIKGTSMEEEIKSSLVIAKELALILEKKRLNRGALDFQFDESKITLAENDKPIEIKAYERRIANDIIEEFMVITNETVAEHFCTLDIPFVYRIHEKPREEKISTAINFVMKLGYDIEDIDNPKKLLQNLLDKAKNKPEEDAVNLLILQSMQQAKYHFEEIGHFGLGATYYSHFTSPIRRYPDLQIHRIIKDYLNNRLNNVRITSLKNRVDKSSKISSKRERQAQNAEILYDNLKKAEYMLDKIGQEFEGIITTVNKNCCKVLLPNTIEGIIPVKNKIDDLKTVVLEEGCSVALTEEKKLTIGDRVKIKLDKVIVEEQLIFFSLI